MSKESNFKLHVTLVEDAIKTLCEEIHSYSPTLFILSEVETLYKSDEKNIPEKISINHMKVDKSNISTLLKKSFGNFYTDQVDDVSTKITKKYPGLIVLPPDARNNIVAIVEQINNLKLNCQDAFHALASNHHSRFDIAHKLFPMLINFQVFRKIPLPLLSGELYSIKFYWRETMLTKKYKKCDILNYLFNKKAAIADQSKIFNKNLEIWNNIDEFIAIVENEPDTSLFRIRRYSSIPTPTANLSIKIDGKLRTINSRASIPFILFQQPQKIRLLENYDVSNIKYSNRLNKTKYKPLISEINLDVLRKNN